MSENYEAVLTIPVSIPPEIIEGGEEGYEAYSDLEDLVLDRAAYALMDCIRQFREAARG